MLEGAPIGAPLQAFYRGLALSEARHAETFIDLAHAYFPAAEVNRRCEELLTVEAQIVNQLPARAALH